MVLNANVPSKELKGIETTTSHFWKQVLKTVTSMNHNREVQQHQLEQLWNNHKIRYKGHPLHLPNCAKKGVNYIQGLWLEGKLLSYEQIAERIGHHAGLVFEYNAIVNAIPKE